MKRPTDCYYLQNKTFFFAPHPTAREDELPLSTPCWCLKTHDPVGPDGGDVDVAVCVSARPCYKPEVDLEA